MYIIKSTKGFEKSLQKIRRAGFTKKDEESLAFVITELSLGKPLEMRHKDHRLKGEFKEYRECHILNDLLYDVYN